MKQRRIVILVLVVSIDFEDFDVFIVSFDGRFINLSLEVTINNYLVIVVCLKEMKFNELTSFGGAQNGPIGSFGSCSC